MRKSLVWVLLSAGFLLSHIGAAGQGWAGGIVATEAAATAAESVSEALTIDRCIEMARANYPMLRQLELTEQSRRNNLSIASSGWIPQLSLSGRATWQSAVTQLPLDLSSLGIPGVPDIPRVSKDQYQLAVELSQVIWDGGAMRAAGAGVKAHSESERAQVEVELYALRQRVADLFFGILSVDKQLELNANFEADLRSAYELTAAAAARGAANRSDLDAVEAETLALRQRTTDLRATAGAFRAVLAAMMGMETGADGLGELAMPALASLCRTRGKAATTTTATAGATALTAGPIPAGSPLRAGSAEALSARHYDNLRPELTLFDARAAEIDAARVAVRARGMPVVGLFVQGGWGRPGLDMLSDKFTTFAIGGVRFSWNFGGLYNRAREMKNLSVRRQSVELTRDTFLFNNDLQQAQLRAALEKYDSLLADDERLIELRASICAACEAKVAAGTAATADLMRDVRASQNAAIAREMHRIEMMRTLWQINNLKNN